MLITEILSLYSQFLQLNDSEGTQDNIPPLPDARDPVVGAPADTGPILPVPKGIRPTLAKYRYVKVAMRKITRKLAINCRNLELFL